MRRNYVNLSKKLIEYFGGTIIEKGISPYDFKCLEFNIPNNEKNIVVMGKNWEKIYIKVSEILLEKKDDCIYI